MQSLCGIWSGFRNVHRRVGELVRCMVVLPASQNRYRATVAFEAGFRTFTGVLVSWYVAWWFCQQARTDTEPLWHLKQVSERSLTCWWVGTLLAYLTASQNRYIHSKYKALRRMFSWFWLDELVHCLVIWWQCSYMWRISIICALSLLFWSFSHWWNKIK